MHELSLARSLWDSARRAAAGAPIVTVRVALGSLSQVDPDSLRASFGLLTACPLEIRPEPARARCAACGHEEEVGFPWSPACPRCGAPVRVTGGFELRLESLEVADEDGVLLPSPVSRLPSAPGQVRRT